MLRKALEYMRTFEPARLRSWLAAAITMATALGFTLSPSVTHQAALWVDLVGACVAALQMVLAEFIRMGVYSPGSMEAIKAAAVDAALNPPEPEPEPEVDEHDDTDGTGPVADFDPPTAPLAAVQSVTLNGVPYVLMPAVPPVPPVSIA